MVLSDKIFTLGTFKNSAVPTYDIKQSIKEYYFDLDRIIEMCPHLENVENTIIEAKARFKKRKFGEGLC